MEKSAIRQLIKEAREQFRTADLVDRARLYQKLCKLRENLNKPRQAVNPSNQDYLEEV